MDLLTREGRQKFYQSEEWRGIREYVLANEPLCRKCFKEGYLVAAKVVDHIIDIVDKPELALEMSNLQPMCVKCHNRKTMSKTMKGRTPKNKKNHEHINRKWKW